MKTQVQPETGTEGVARTATDENRQDASPGVKRPYQPPVLQEFAEPAVVFGTTTQFQFC